MEGLVPFCFDFLAVTWCGLGSSFGAAEQQLPVEENFTFLTSVTLRAAMSGSLAGDLQAQLGGPMETECMIVDKAITIRSRGLVASP